MPPRSNRKPQIVIAAEHALFCDGLCTLVRASRRFQVIHDTSDGVDALRRTQELRPKVLVLDLEAANLPETAALRDIVSSFMATAVIVLTRSLDRPSMSALIEIGVRGVVLKAASADVLLNAIEAVVAGGCWIDREPVSNFAQALKSVPQPRRDYGLTERECEIIAAVAAAYANKDIAQLFSISETTVKHHLTSIFDKTGVSTRLELAMFAINKGLQSSAAVVPSVV